MWTSELMTIYFTESWNYCLISEESWKEEEGTLVLTADTKENAWWCLLVTWSCPHCLSRQNPEVLLTTCVSLGMSLTGSEFPQLLWNINNDTPVTSVMRLRGSCGSIWKYLNSKELVKREVYYCCDILVLSTYFHLHSCFMHYQNCSNVLIFVERGCTVFWKICFIINRTLNFYYFQVTF